MYSLYLPDIVSTGLYNIMLADWLHFFPLKNFIIIDGAQVTHKPNLLFPIIQEKLALKQNFFTNTSFKKDFISGFYCLEVKKNSSSHDSPSTNTTRKVCAHSPGKGRTSSKAARKSWKYTHDMTDEMKKMLKEFYAEPNRDLVETLGRNFTWIR